ncbi:MAG: SurA N-terminal domain-containing protein [Candidatus Saccharibacteria bacterium]|nr:SurA N-terminal domain-containing protein [Candidatus Saccharibacteria bacterium]
MTKTTNKITKDDTKIATLRGKLADKLPSRKPQPAARITNDNISEHRENILARGRKLKYPMQYSKNRLLITTIVVIVVAVTGFSLWLHNSLYRQQQTGDFYYSVSKILPLSVADVDGAKVRYQDYLRRVRADIHYYLNREGRSFNSDEGKKELDYHKRKNLLTAERAAYVRKLAKDNNVTVTRAEADVKIKQMREADGASEEDLISTLNSYYGWTLDDFRSTITDQLLEQKLVYAIDKDAKKEIEQIEKQLQQGSDFATIAKESSDDSATSANGGAVNVKASISDPTGIVDEAKKLEIGKLTDIKKVQVDNVNYYYIARLDSKTDDQISYSIIMIKLDKLDRDFAKLQKDGKVHEYISVPAESDFAKQ